MAPSRLPRFKRSAEAAPIRITQRDGQIIRLVHRYRFVRSSHITALLGNHSPQVLRRLQLLYHHGYLERPRAQLDYYHRGGSQPIVYGLGSKSVAYVKEQIAYVLPAARWGEKNRSIGRIFLEHALLVSDVMVAIELGCQEKGVRLLTDAELVTTAEDSKRPSFRWSVRTEGVKLGVIPDRVFGLEYTKPNGTRERAYFFLEADRGTMPVIRHSLSQTSFYRKLLAYEATWSQSLHEKLFGFHRFRVLTVTKSAQRVASLMKACTELKRGHGLFLFADRSILETPKGILSSFWHTGRQGETATLLD
jgi:hypothetical protein